MAAKVGGAARKRVARARRSIVLGVSYDLSE